MMTRQDFQRMATAVGIAGRDLSHSSYLDVRQEVANACHESNGRFDREKFFCFADEVRDGKRDMHGRIKAAVTSS